MSDYGAPWYPEDARSVIASKTSPDLINSFAKRVKSGMKALVVKVEYIANHDEAKEPVMKLQVPKSLLSRTTDESNEAQQTHLNQLPTRVELEPLHMERL
jgi:formyltetrahydrofolate hydrolase